MITRYLKAFLLTITSFGTGIFGGMLVANASQTPDIDPYDGFYTFSLNLHRIQNDYITEVATKDLIYHAITGMMSALDEHSTYFPPMNMPNYSNVLDSMNGRLVWVFKSTRKKWLLI